MAANTANSSIYDILPLPEGEHIRVLSLQPGLAHEPLSGVLLVVNLQEPHILYDALSYVWGNQNLTHSIVIDGLALRITASAFELLSRLRKIDHAISVWIDAVCLHQVDPLERASQVTFMHRIYELARTTIIWLGPEDPTTKTAIEFMQRLDVNKIKLQFRSSLAHNGEHMLAEPAKQIWEYLEGNEQIQPVTSACAKFLLKPWFTRVWVQQEAAMCLHTTVLCGSCSIPWDNVFCLSWLFWPHTSLLVPEWADYSPVDMQSTCSAVNGIQVCRNYREDKDARQRSSQNFCQLLHEVAWHCSATDPRDKVYAMRNISLSNTKDTSSWLPEPDYIIDWRVLYVEVSRKLLETNHPEVISCAGLIRRSEHCGLPSWAPDLRSWEREPYVVLRQWRSGGCKKLFHCKFPPLTRKRRRQLDDWRASTHGDLSPGLKSKFLVLSLQIVFQDRPLYFSGVVDGYEGFRASRERISEIDRANYNYIVTRQPERYVNGESRVEAYGGTLIAGTTETGDFAPLSFYRGYSSWRQWLHDGAREERDSGYDKAIVYCSPFNDKKFCVTQSGLFCLVPPCTKQTDVIVIIHGTPAPYVLRPSVDDSFVLIGMCYVHGMMQSNADILIEEFNVKIRDGKRTWRRDCDNKRKVDAGEYVRILDTLGEKWINII